MVQRRIYRMQGYLPDVFLICLLLCSDRNTPETAFYYQVRSADEIMHSLCNTLCPIYSPYEHYNLFQVNVKYSLR